MDQDNCTHDCASCGEDCSDSIEDKIDEDALHSLSIVKKAVLIASAKGGVGKSTIAAKLACELAQQGKIVGILDASMSASSINIIFGTNDVPEIIKGGIHPVKTKLGIQIISFPLLTANPSAPMFWEGSKSAAFAKQLWTDVIWDNLDVLLIDTPSDTADITQIYFKNQHINDVIIVTDPTELSALVTARTINYAKMNQINILGLIENFSDGDSESSSTKELLAGFALKLLDRIPTDARLSACVNNGSIESYDDVLLPKISALFEE